MSWPWIFSWLKTKIITKHVTLIHQEYTLFFSGLKHGMLHKSNWLSYLFEEATAVMFPAVITQCTIGVCVIRVDATGQQSVCLSSGYCHRQRQEAGQWLPGSTGMKRTLKVLIQVILHNTCLSCSLWLVSIVHSKLFQNFVFNSQVLLKHLCFCCSLSFLSLTGACWL